MSRCEPVLCHSHGPPQMLAEFFERGSSRFEIRSLAIHHVAPESGVIRGIVGTGRDPLDCLQRFTQRIGLVGGKIPSVRLCIGLHDLPRKARHVLGIVTPSDRVQVVQVTDQRRIVFLTQTGQFGAGAAGERDKLFRRGFRQSKHTGSREFRPAANNRRQQTS